MQTIFALGTARGKAGVAVVRVSGPEAMSVGQRLVGALPVPGMHALRAIRGPGGEILDQGLVLVFGGPKSFTGEDCVEFQIHGSMAVVRAVERAIADTRLARPAEAGEFTKRALANGKLDLTQVEALGDLIAAETEVQRKQAMRVLDGDLTRLLDQLRSDLVRAMALIEATIDFADEDVPVDVSPEVAQLLERVIGNLSAQIDGSQTAERVREGFEVAILGAPNVGKSTLLNRIAGREIAITSHVAGTTRDVLEVQVDLKGLPVTFLDTAGLRDASDEVERIGIDRALARADAADICVLLSLNGMSPDHHPLVEADIVLRAKADTGGEVGGISGLTGAGVDDLLDRVGAILEQRTATIGVATHERHRMAMERAMEPARIAYDMLMDGDAEAEVVAENLRIAAGEITSVVGSVDVESVLGEIFAEFCIGK